MPRSWVRWLIARGIRRVVLPSDVRLENLDVNGVHCECLTPRGADPRRVLLYIHGGGFVFGWTHWHRAMVAGLVQRLGMTAVAVRYRLAPEHPFPDGLDDCLTVYRWMLDQGTEPKNIALAGDSAGGNFVLTMLIALREAGLPLPGCGVGISPVPDFPADEKVLARGVRDDLLHPRALRYFRKAYAGKLDVSNPLLSPVHGDLRGLPPLLIHAGEEEVLREDMEKFAAVASRADVDVTLTVWPRMWHGFHLFYPHMPQAVEALDVIAAFIRKRMHARTSAPAPISTL